MDILDSNIFDGKKLKDIFQEIYNNQKKKERQISELIGELKPMVESIGDATLVVPLIKEYLEIGVKNDEQLIKMTSIIQRCFNATVGSENENSLSEEEKAQILGEIKKLDENLNKTKE